MLHLLPINKKELIFCTIGSFFVSIIITFTGLVNNNLYAIEDKTNNIYGRLQVQIIAPYRSTANIEQLVASRKIIAYPYHPLKKNQKIFLTEDKNHSVLLYSNEELEANPNLSVEYVVEVVDDNYQVFRTNVIFLPQKKSISIIVRLKPKPFNLKLQNIPLGTEIFINQKKMVTALDNNITFANIEEHAIELFLLKDNYHYYKKMIVKQNLNENVIVQNPIFIDYRNTALVSSMLGLLPGLNVIMHFPASGLGALIPTAFVFYTAATLRVLSFSTDIRWLSPTKPNINLTAIDVLIVSSSLLHALFTYLYAASDNKKIIDKYSNEKFKYSFHFENSSSTFNEWSAYVKLVQLW